MIMSARFRGIICVVRLVSLSRRYLSHEIYSATLCVGGGWCFFIDIAIWAKFLLMKYQLALAHDNDFDTG